MSSKRASAERLDRARILASAMSLADAQGLDSVTLRRLATRWNVTPMALYRHFEDKDALLDAMVEQMLGELDVGTGTGDLRSVISAVLGVLRAHPSLAQITPTRLLRTDAGVDLTERVVGLLRADGHTPVGAAHVSIFILDALIGLVVRQPGEMSVPDPEVRQTLLTAKRVRLATLSPADYPHLAESAEYFLGVPDEDEYYERGLALLLKAVQPGPVT